MYMHGQWQDQTNSQMCGMFEAAFLWKYEAGFLKMTLGHGHK